ncbi:MAG: hypothetical protein IKA76_03210 [Clostridia bacterium]|nr:hypothetical protein [Clostridia bacterium]
MNPIQIGWSEVSIVPDGRRVKLDGQFYERISGEVETPISITALAMECGDDHAVFVGCDLSATGSDLLKRVREVLPDHCGFDKSKLIISAIHTHTSMRYENISDNLGGDVFQILDRLKPDHIEYVPLVRDDSPDILCGEEAREFLADRIARAAMEAWERRADAVYAFGFGRAAVGLCRRSCYDDGSAKMWGKTNHANFTELESGNDSGIELMFTYDKEKKLTGVVANVACPAQVLQHQNLISSDYMGKVKGLIREKYGKDVNFLGLISPAGDMCPIDLIRWVPSPVCKNDPNIPQDAAIERRADPSMFEIKGCEKAAKRIATEIFWALEDVTEYVSESTLIHKNLTVDMPLRKVTIEEYETAKKAVEDYFAACKGDINYEDNAKLLVHSGTMARYTLQQSVDMYPIEVHVMRLGDVAFATNPYELFLNYGNQIRARSLAKQTFLVELSCGCYGYLPTEKAEKGSHYSAFVGSGHSDHVGGDLLVRKTLREINAMFSEENV